MMKVRIARQIGHCLRPLWILPVGAWLLVNLPLLALELETGVVIDRVSCRLFPDQSYALYLPRAYNERKAWPVLFCFDPGGRGRIPVELFRPAAEELGMVVIGSNNSENGVNFTPACQAAWSDGRARLNLDERAVFCAGFSGGAHVAFSFSQVVSVPVRGIIACSNGLPDWLSPQQIARETAVYLLAGQDDFNNQPTKDLVNAFSSLGIWSHADIFDGAHEWPPQQLAGAALYSLFLRAQMAGAVSVDPALLQAFLTGQQRSAEDAAARGDEMAAFLAWSRLAALLAGKPEGAAAAAAAASLKKTAAVADGLSRCEKMDRRENEIRAELQPAYLGLFAPGQTAIEIAQGIRALEIDRLRQASAASKPSPEKTANIRVISELYLTAYVDGSQYRDEKEWAMAEIAFEIMRRIKPDRWQPEYNLAIVAAGRNQRENTLKLLKTAVEKGLVDPSLLADPAFDFIREEKPFQEVLSKIQTK